MPEVNYLAVIAAAVATFLLGGLWYSSALFGKAWQREAGVSEAQMKNADMAKIFGLAFVLSLVAAGSATGLRANRRSSPGGAPRSRTNTSSRLARGAVEKDGKPKGYTICATKNVKVAPATCYGAFASAAALDEWFGPRHDARMEEGGHWRNADGNQASVRKVTPGKTIRLVWEDAGLTMPTPVEIKFAPNGAKTAVMVTIERLRTRAEADGYRRAWGQALERLERALE